MRMVSLALLSLLTIWFAVGVKSATVEVFILAGQSNAVGASCDVNELPVELQVAQEDVWFWFEEGQLDPGRRISSGGILESLNRQFDPTGVTIFGTQAYPVYEGFGSELMMGRRLADNLRTGVALIKFGINGTRIYPYWNPNDPASLFQQMTANVEAALNELRALGYTPRIQALFWMQGESDALRIDYANIYEAKLRELVAAIRTRFADPQLPVFIGRLCSEMVHSGYYNFPCLNHIRAAQEQIAATVPNVYLVNTDDLPLDYMGVHFTSTGQCMLGERFARTYLVQSIPSTTTLGIFLLLGLMTAILKARTRIRKNSVSDTR